MNGSPLQSIRRFQVARKRQSMSKLWKAKVVPRFVFARFPPEILESLPVESGCLQVIEGRDNRDRRVVRFRLVLTQESIFKELS